MKRIHILVILMASFGVSAQMYVSPNSYVYVNDQALFVKQDINLQNDSNLYLRNDSQLLQGTTALSANIGQGKLSVFQEGTSDNYDYNYWCSPVGDALAVSGNSNFGITMLNAPIDARMSDAAIMLSTGSLDGIASPLSIAQRWVFKFISSNNYSQWVAVNAATNIAAGEGFTMKGSSGNDGTTVNGVQNNPGSAQRYDFRGKPNDGNISINVGANNMTLTGNPYPSALDVSKFLLDPANAACDATAYYWEQNKTVNSHFIAQYQGGYGTFVPVSTAMTPAIEPGIYVPAFFNTYDGSGNLATTGTSSGLVIERRFAPIGQGFMIEGVSSGTVTLKNEHRAYYKESASLSQFERLAGQNTAQVNVVHDDRISHLRINAIVNDQVTRQLALAFAPFATDGIDRGLDGQSPDGDVLPTDIYFPIDNQRFVIEGVNFDIGKRIPLGIKAANNTNLRFYIPEIINFDESQNVYIYDALDNSYHNIRTGNYDLMLDAGVYEGRFEVTFTDATLGVPTIKDDSFDIVQNNAAQTLSISNPDGIALKSCSLYDIGGKLILNKTSLGSESNYSFSTIGISEGVYIVKLVTSSNQDFGKKITVFRKNN